ncbi:MAG: ribonuclease D [Pseudomonadota bacterium]
MQIITTTEALASFCDDCAQAPYVTVDTEFLRERTYYAQLCLVQLARPHPPGAEPAEPANTESGESRAPVTAAILDPMAEGIDLAPLYALFRNPAVVKVFHAARQDLEIFWQQGAVMPTPVFDTQVAAMVCGLGDQASYESLVRKVAKAELDKSARFTDWSLRPLSQKQLAYALADVTHLRVIYERLSERLAQSGRTGWVTEEMAVLTDPGTYQVVPDEAWRRLKTRSSAPKFLAVVQALAAWRERAAQSRDVPRNRILKDDALLEIASNRPGSIEELSRSRLLQREGRKKEVLAEILEAVRAGVACPPDARPVPPEPPAQKSGSPALGDLLRVLLKAKADAAGVAPRLIASAADLDRIAGGAAEEIPALSGWRRKVFGADAERLRAGLIALSAGKNGVRIVELDSAGTNLTPSA